MTAATLEYGAYGSRPLPAMGRAATLSALVHLALLGVLFLGVRFQNSPPATVTVELWDQPPPPPRVEEKPPTPPPKPAPEPEPEPQVKKPDIALREKPKPKPKPKPEPKRDLAFEKQLREQAMLEQKRLDDARRERETRELIARQQAAAFSKAQATWRDKIAGKIRGNIVMPQDIPDNAAAIFDVAILPTGEVLTVRKRKPSGFPKYDDAVERAILKSSPLPLPEDRRVFERELQLTFRPQDYR